MIDAVEMCSDSRGRPPSLDRRTDHKNKQLRLLFSFFRSFFLFSLREMKPAAMGHRGTLSTEDFSSSSSSSSSSTVPKIYSSGDCRDRHSSSRSRQEITRPPIPGSRTRAATRGWKRIAGHSKTNLCLQPPPPPSVKVHVHVPHFTGSFQKHSCRQLRFRALPYSVPLPVLFAPLSARGLSMNCDTR